MQSPRSHLFKPFKRFQPFKPSDPPLHPPPRCAGRKEVGVTENDLNCLNGWNGLNYLLLSCAIVNLNIVPIRVKEISSSRARAADRAQMELYSPFARLLQK